MCLGGTMVYSRFLLGLSNSNPACNMWKTCDVENFRQLYWLEISLNEILHHCHYHH